MPDSLPARLVHQAAEAPSSVLLDVLVEHEAVLVAAVLRGIADDLDAEADKHGRRAARALRVCAARYRTIAARALAARVKEDGQDG